MRNYALTAASVGPLVVLALLGGPLTPAVVHGWETSPINQYLVEFKGKHLPSDLNARLSMLAGTLVDVAPEVGVAILGNITPEGAGVVASWRDVNDLMPDVLLDPPRAMDRPLISGPPALAPSSAADPTQAAGYPLQWNMRVIGADKAWQAGQLGSPGVRIAIVDSGLDPTHADVASLIDPTRSTAMCTSDGGIISHEFPGYPSWTDLLGHGTFVASVAASDAVFVAGVTSRSTLMGIKVLSISSCPLSSWFRGMRFASDNGADVINVSLGLQSLLPRGAHLTPGTWAKWFHVYVEYALQKGVSAVVVAAGNDAIDLDKDQNLYAFACDTPGVICVSATGPTNSGPQLLGPFANIDAVSFYSNFGSPIDVAAPGGNLSFDASGNTIGFGVVFGACAHTDREIVGGVVVPGFCSANGVEAAGGIGTSFAAPHVSGLAALLVDRLGHNLSPQVKNRILQTADDRGKPGADPWYGRGRINVARALGLE